MSNPIKPDGPSMLAEAMSMVAAMQQRILVLAGENGALRQQLEQHEKVSVIRRTPDAAE